MKVFDQISSKAPKNPLGIIALFIALIYGLASWVLSSAGNSLDIMQKWVFVIFLVLFPVIVLVIFTWLVVRHHGKFYSPADFRDDSSFLRTLTPVEQRLKRLGELQNVESNNNLKEDSLIKSSEDVELINGRETFFLEDLALRELEAELNSPIRRQVEIKGETSTIGVDGAIINAYGIIIIEIKYLTKLSVLDNYIPKFLDQAKKVGIELKQSKKYGAFNIIFAILYDSKSLKESVIAEKLKNIVPKISGILIDFRLYEELYLKSKYLIDKNS